MNGLTRLRFGDLAWHVRSDVSHLLFDSMGLRLPSWLQAGQASIVKHGPHRTVYRVQLDGRSVYVKHYRVADARAMFSQWAQSSKSRREWDHAERAAAASIPTFVPLALGEQRKAGFVFENFLVTEGIDDVEPLDRFVQDVIPKLAFGRQTRIRLRLTHGLAELVAKLHDAGVLHPDLHAGNVLVRLHESDAIELFLIDLQEAKSSDRNDWRRSRENLLAFGLFFFTMARSIDRARFLRRYLELRSHLGIDWRVEGNRLEHDLRRKAFRFWRKLDYRCTTNNRRFFYRNIGSAHGFAVTELGEAAMQPLLRDPDAPLGVASAEVLKESPSSNVVRLPMSVGGACMPVIYKRFNCPKRLDALRATLHHSPALRAWHAGHALLIRRIPTPRPLAMIERIRGPFVRESYLITQAIPDAVNLKDYLQEVVSKLPPESRRRRVRWLVGQLGQFLRHMHERNISHRDMKASNFLIEPADPAVESPKIYLIDLVGVQVWRRLPASRCVQNVTRVVASLQSYQLFTQTDFMRLLCAYRPAVRHRKRKWKTFWYDIQRRVAQKIARNRENSRPVA
jgi:tRNA A-37 threonylcarbamoyl transferase component Bud32